MTPNRANIDLVFRSLRAEFVNAYEQAMVQWMDIAMEVNSSTKIQEYPWLTNFPKMREWVGERVVKQLAAHVYRLSNRDFEGTIEVDRNDFEDDQLSMYAAQAQGYGAAARAWPDEVIFDAVNNSFSAEKGRCHDGQAFFSAAHPLDDAPSFSNLLDVALDSSTLAAAKASFGKAKTRLLEMKDPDGRPLGLRPKTLLVPPALEDEANILMMAPKLDDDKPNPYKGQAKVVCSPRLTSPTAWFLLAESGKLKAFLWQLRKMPDFDALTDPSNPIVFMRRKLMFGIHGRGEAGYTLPQLAVGSTGA